ncbi:MAG: MGMT family protein [Bacteroidales bacterium]|nr:MGMT family protein [Bacteroidales bacterium]
MMKTDDDFFNRVYRVTRSIPYGRVSSYGAIARYIGSPGASRMVGWALNNCHRQEDFIPAHRVVNRNGILTGKHHFRHPGLMQELLESEGIRVENDRIVNFPDLFWDPCSYLI